MRASYILHIGIAFAAALSESFAQGTWTAKAPLSAAGRWAPFGFSIGNKGYLGTGQNTATNVTYNDFWEYDPAANSWTQKANFGGGPRNCAAAFALGGYGYAGTGRNGTGTQFSDLWRYDPVTNSWLQMASLTTVRQYAFAFSISGKGYLGTGQNGTNLLSDLWEYDPAANAWTAKANYQGGLRMDIDKAVFVICKKAYLGTGFDGSDKTDFWEYDPATNLWTQKANFPGAARRGATGFSIGNSGFLGLGSQNIITYYSNFWKYNPATNSWTPISAFPGAARFDAPSFVINNKAYVGCSAENLSPVTNFNDLWEYTPVGVTGGTLSALGSATICAGQSATLTASGSTTYTWSNGSTTSTIVVSPSATTTYSVFAPSFCGGNDTAVVTITCGGSLTPTVTGNTTICPGGTATLTASGGSTYSWSNGASTSSIIVSPGSTTTYSVLVSTGGCSGTATGTITVSSVGVPFITGNTLICAGDIATLTASGGANYVWSNGATTSSITTSPATTTGYSVTVSGACGGIASATVTVTNAVVASIICQDICGGDSATLIASGGAGYLWSNGAATSAITVSPAAAASYSVIVSAGSCADTASCTVSVFPAPIVTAASDTSIETGGTATLTASGGGTYLWSNGSTDNVITVAPVVTTVFTVTVTDANGCTGTAIVTVTIDDPCSVSTAGELFVPNAFSPNQDGENDVLEVYYGNFKCLESLNLTIYDRWGEKVFSIQGKSDSGWQAFSWDGTYKGKPLAPAVFAYYLEGTLITGEAVVKRGNVSLMK